MSETGNEIAASPQQARLLRRPKSDAWPYIFRRFSASPARIERALVELQARHEILRTTFKQTAAGARQIVNVCDAANKPVVTWVDPEHVSSLSEVDSTQLFQDFIIAPFDLEQGPVWRTMCIEGTDHCIVLVVVHHVASDPTSMALFERDLARLSSQEGVLAVSGAKPDVAEATYREFTVYQSAMKGIKNRARLRQYWHGQRSPQLPARLPWNDRSSRPEPVFASSDPLVFDATVVNQASVKARTLGTSESALWVAAIATSLLELLSEDEVSIGVPVDNRVDPRWSRVSGPFTNMLPLTVAKDEKLGEVADRFIAHLDHQGLFFDDIMETLRVDPASVNVAVAVDLSSKSPSAKFEKVRQLSVSGIARYDLSLSLNRGPDGVFGSLAMPIDALPEAGRRQFVQDLQSLITSMVSKKN